MDFEKWIEIWTDKDSYMASLVGLDICTGDLNSVCRALFYIGVMGDESEYQKGLDALAPELLRESLQPNNLVKNDLVKNGLVKNDLKNKRIAYFLYSDSNRRVREGLGCLELDVDFVNIFKGSGCIDGPKCSCGVMISWSDKNNKAYEDGPKILHDPSYDGNGPMALDSDGPRYRKNKSINFVNQLIL